MATTKMIKKDYFATIRAIVEETHPDDTKLLNFIDHEVDLLNKKSTSTKPTKTQTENAVIEQKITNALNAINKPVTISEMQAEVPELDDYSNQKLSAIMTNMRKRGELVKLAAKKKTYFVTAEWAENNDTPEGMTVVELTK